MLTLVLTAALPMGWVNRFRRPISSLAMGIFVFAVSFIALTLAALRLGIRHPGHRPGSSGDAVRSRSFRHRACIRRICGSAVRLPVAARCRIAGRGDRRPRPAGDETASRRWRRTRSGPWRVLVFVIWLPRSYASTSWIVAAAFVVAFVVLYCWPCSLLRAWSASSPCGAMRRIRCAGCCSFAVLAARLRWRRRFSCSPLSPPPYARAPRRESGCISSRVLRQAASGVVGDVPDRRASARGDRATPHLRVLLASRWRTASRAALAPRWGGSDDRQPGPLLFLRVEKPRSRSGTRVPAGGAERRTVHRERLPVALAVSDRRGDVVAGARRVVGERRASVGLPPSRWCSSA